ncbi:MAG TPA: glycine--tRNA ligase, partial [Phycisphaerae bacterium]|nr:glycine--tRNA ligase [Phycisphaerae bacterium]
MDRIVALCKRRGFIFQSSEIYGGINGFWDYGPLGVELKRNVKEAWWTDMVRNREDMVGLDCSIIMHPQVWKVSGHYDLFCDWMVDCQECKARFRHDQLCVWHVRSGPESDPASKSLGYFATIGSGDDALTELKARATKIAKKMSGGRLLDEWKAEPIVDFRRRHNDSTALVRCPNCDAQGTFTAPREFNLMFETYIGAMKDEDSKSFLRPETAQGIFVNFKNVCDTTRIKVPFGIAQIGKSFRNEITPRNFIFRTREFEQMEIEFFCHPSESN